MPSADINLLMRYLAQVEPKQAALATWLIDKDLTVAEPCFIGLVAVCVSWSMSRPVDSQQGCRDVAQSHNTRSKLPNISGEFDGLVT